VSPSSPESYTYASDRVVQKNFVKTVRLVEWFLRLKLPEFQALNVVPSIADLHQIVVEASTTDWSGLLPIPVIKAFIDAFLMLLGASEGLNWRVESCPCQKISPITTKLVFSLSWSQ